MFFLSTDDYLHAYYKNILFIEVTRKKGSTRKYYLAYAHQHIPPPNIYIYLYYWQLAHFGHTRRTKEYIIIIKMHAKLQFIHVHGIRKAKLILIYIYIIYEHDQLNIT